MRKLRYVDALMKNIRENRPLRTAGELCTPVEEMTALLAEHYGARAERYRAAAQGYVDDKLREVFPPARGRTLLSAGDLLRQRRRDLLSRVAHWSALPTEEVKMLLDKLEDRAEALDLQFRSQEGQIKLLDLTALATALALDFAYTGGIAP